MVKPPSIRTKAPKSLPNGVRRVAYVVSGSFLCNPRETLAKTMARAVLNFMAFPEKSFRSGLKIQTKIIGAVTQNTETLAAPAKMPRECKLWCSFDAITLSANIKFDSPLNNLLSV